MNCPTCNVHIDEHAASRCLDAWVAEAVMEYTIEKRLCSPCECGWQETESIYSEDEMGLFSLDELEKRKEAMPDNIMWCFLEEDGWWEVLPKYFSYIAAAWQVHQKACSWLFSKRRAYFTALRHIVSDRETEGEHLIAWPDVMIFIKPEDFCRAAIKACHQGDTT